MEIYFTEQFLTYLSESFGTMANKIVLLADDSEIEVNADIATLPPELALVKKAEAKIDAIQNKFDSEYSGKIKNADKKWKRKSPVLAGTLTELTWGTSTGTITDLSLWGLESLSDLLGDSAINIFPNMTTSSIFGETISPTWETEYGYSSEPSLYYSSDQALFVRENPTNRFVSEVFERVFNSSTDYGVYMVKTGGFPSTLTYPYGTFTSEYINSNSDLLFLSTSSDMYPVYHGSYMAGTSVVPINTMAGLLSYPGATTTFQIENDNLIAYGSASSLTSFLFSTDTGLMYATFSDLQVAITSTQPIAGYFVTNESIKRPKPGGVNTAQLPNELPLMLYTVKFDDVSFGHQPGKGNYSILTMPKISLTMDVVII